MHVRPAGHRRTGGAPSRLRRRGGPLSPRLSGVLLAGGRGRRFGASKTGALLNGRPLLYHGIDLLAPRCREVIVSARAELEMPPVPAFVGRCPVRVVHDGEGPDAPLNGVASALAVAGESQTLLLACDLPLAGPLLDRLVRTARDERPVVAVDPDGRPQPLCAVYPTAECLSAALGLLGTGTFRMGALVDALGPVVSVAATAEELLNVNQPDDLRRAAALL